MPKLDVGLIWAKVVNVWGQLGTIAGIANTIMLLVVTYSTSVSSHMSAWLYILIIVLVAMMWITFIIKYGISGYYRFLSNRSELTQVNNRVALIMKHLNIKEDELEDRH